jgi:hypothetical protein
MKSSVRLLIYVILLLLSLKSFSQSIGIRAGINLSDFIGGIKIKPGFNIGASINLPIREIYSLEPVLLFTEKGFRIIQDMPDLETMDTYNIYYLDIQIPGKASFKAGSTIIYAILGPYIGMGLFGNEKYKSTVSGVKHSDVGTISFGTDLRRMDYGLVVGTGVKIKSLQIGTSCALGLANIASKYDPSGKVRNIVIDLSAVYFFKSKN